MHPINRIRSTIASLKAAFVRLVTAIEDNNTGVESLRAEQSALRESLTAIEQNTRFLADAKRREHERAGHRIR